MRPPRSIRVNAAFPFPALVQGSGGVTVAKNNGIWTIGYTNPAPPPSGALNQFTSRVIAAAAMIDPGVQFIQTGGYNFVGDGGHALYAKTTAIVYPTYGFTSGDGAHWEYIPEPTGWNAAAAGVLADGATDDTQNVMNALLPFQDPTIIVGGGGVTGTLLMPVGLITLRSPVVVVGNTGISLRIRGQSIGAQNIVGTTFQWQGVGFPSMFITHGVNNFHLEEINFDGYTTSHAGSGLQNSIHLNSDNTIGPPFFPQLTLVSPVTAGANRVFSMSGTVDLPPPTSPGIAIGAGIGVSPGTPQFEIVYVTAVSGSTFTANCVHNHASGDKVGPSYPSNGLFLIGCSIVVPSGVKTAGVLCGNEIGSTVQVSEFLFRSLNLIGGGSPLGECYSGIRSIRGGNIKNWSLENCQFENLNTGFAGELMSGNCNMTYLTFSASTVVDILANGATLLISNYESESQGNMMLKGVGGASPQAATIIQSSYQCGLPADQYMIDWGGSLTLINNTFFSGPGPAAGLAPKIRISELSNFAPLGRTSPSGVCSIGNWYQNGGPDVPVFFDGSNNPVNFQDFAVTRRWAMSQFNDYGDQGKYRDTIGGFQVISAALSIQRMSAGPLPSNQGAIGDTFSSVTIPFAALQATSTGKLVSLWDIPPNTIITGVILDVTTPFKGPGITSLTLSVGTVGTVATELLKASDAFTAAATFGLVNADLGVGLASATRPSPLGFTSAWSSGTDLVTLTATSGGANLSALAQGAAILYIACKRFTF